VCALRLQYTFPNAPGSGSPAGGSLTPIFSTPLGSETTSPFWCARHSEALQGGAVCALGCMR
jgi:hypothetical protein